MKGFFSKTWRVSVSFGLIVCLHSAAFAMASRPNADPNAPPPPFWVQWVPMIVMLGVFYFLLLRPQMNQRKERQKLLDSLKKGDKIVTQGGFFATVVNVWPTVLEVKLNEEMKVKIQRSAVADILPAQAVEAKEEGISVSK